MRHLIQSKASDTLDVRGDVGSLRGWGLRGQCARQACRQARPAGGAGLATGQQQVGQPPAGGERGGEGRRDDHGQQHQQHHLGAVAQDVALVAAVARLVQRQRAQRRLQPSHDDREGR